MFVLLKKEHILALSIKKGINKIIQNMFVLRCSE